MFRSERQFYRFVYKQLPFSGIKLPQLLLSIIVAQLIILTGLVNLAFSQMYDHTSERVVMSLAMIVAGCIHLVYVVAVALSQRHVLSAVIQYLAIPPYLIAASVVTWQFMYVVQHEYDFRPGLPWISIGYTLSWFVLTGGWFTPVDIGVLCVTAFIINVVTAAIYCYLGVPIVSALITLAMVALVLFLSFSVQLRIYARLKRAYNTVTAADAALSAMDAQKLFVANRIRMIMPPHVLARLELGQRDVVEEMSDVAVIVFRVTVADTPSNRSPMTVQQRIRTINDCFTIIADCGSQCGVDRIKSTGAKLIFLGRDPSSANVPRFVSMAFEQLSIFPHTDTRVGIALGAVLGGIVGRDRFQYDIWGVPVNLANLLLELAGRDQAVVSSVAHEVLNLPDAAQMCATRVRGFGLQEPWIIDRSQPVSYGETTDPETTDWTADTDISVPELTGSDTDRTAFMDATFDGTAMPDDTLRSDPSDRPSDIHVPAATLANILAAGDGSSLASTPVVVPWRFRFASADLRTEYRRAACRDHTSRLAVAPLVGLAAIVTLGNIAYCFVAGVSSSTALLVTAISVTMWTIFAPLMLALIFLIGTTRFKLACLTLHMSFLVFITHLICVTLAVYINDTPTTSTHPVNVVSYQVLLLHLAMLWPPCMALFDFVTEPLSGTVLTGTVIACNIVVVISDPRTVAPATAVCGIVLSSVVYNFKSRLLTSLVFFTVMREAFALRARASVINGKKHSLLNLMYPAPVALALQAEVDPVQPEEARVAVLVFDVASFTKYTSSMAPKEVVGMLDWLFAIADAEVKRLRHKGVYKLKSTGDAYIAVCGAPTPNARPVAPLAALAIRVIQRLSRSPEGYPSLCCRFGIGFGPAVLGMMGVDPPALFDIMGPAIEDATDMERCGVVNRLVVSSAAVANWRDTDKRTMRGYRFKPHSHKVGYLVTRRSRVNPQSTFPARRYPVRSPGSSVQTSPVGSPVMDLGPMGNVM